MRNTIAFRKNLVCLPASNIPAGQELALSVTAELMQLGFMPTEAASKMLANASREDLVKFHDEVIDYLLTIMGGKGNFRPFWKNFPQDAMDRTEAELLAHMLLNYWTGGAYEPSEFTHTRPTAYERASYTSFDAGTEEDFKNIFKDLVSVNQSLTPEDLEAVKWFAANVPDLPMPKVIPFKETLCTVASLGLDVPVKTVTDVLRIAVALSGGDVSLPKVPRKTIRGRVTWRVPAAMVENPKRVAFKFRKFSRPERQYILGLLEKTDANASEAVLKDQRWIRLGEILHPGEYKLRFPKSFKMFMDIRNDKVQSWNGKLEEAFKVSFDKGLDVLAERPGELMRRIDALVRKNDNEATEKTLQKMFSVSQKVSNKVLVEAFSHFGRRDKPVTNRTIMVKGARKRTKLPDLPALSTGTVADIKDTILAALTAKFSKLETLGETYVPEELKNIAVPTNMRSLNPSLKPTARGTLIPWDNPDAKVIRAFLHFSKPRTSITIDLSAVLYGMGKSAICSWSGQKPLDNAILHSGDSWMRKGDCAEYVDLNVAELLKLGFRYVLIQLNNYNCAPELVENNYFGVMERDEPRATKKWLPKTISNCAQIRVENKVNCAIIDLESRTYTMVDEDLGKDGMIHNASVRDLDELRAYFEPPRFSVYDLISMHVKARGSQVFTKDEATTVIEVEPFQDSYVETLKWLGV